MRRLGDVVGALQQRQIGLRVALPVQDRQRLEHGPHQPAALTRDDATGQPVAHPAAGRAGLRIDRFGSDVVGTAHRGALRKGAADRRLGSRARYRPLLRRAAGRRGSRVGSYVGGHGCSCGLEKSGTPPC